MANLGGQMQDLQKVKDAMAEDLAAANAEKARLKMEKQDLQQEKDAMADDFAAANMEMANLGGQMQDLQKAKDAMAKDLSSANADKARLNGDIFSCSWKLKDVTKERDAAVKLNTRHRGTILRKDEEITSKNEEITTLSDNMAAAIAEKDAMAEELASAKETNARLQESLANKERAGDGDGSGISPECLHLNACGMSLSVTEREWSW